MGRSLLSRQKEYHARRGKRTPHDTTTLSFTVVLPIGSYCPINPSSQCGV
uniref:Uncharacterized protein n=1 Tax=Vibrio tasmaniensis TaxID=212663 RepID=A0A0H3ZJ10_9VIBR|nr:hypothetical protein [Vibrio tasmaniensis]